ncbi:MAG: APC family permease, partial [Myxococcales bacterium]
MAELRRALGLLDATMVNVGVMIGSAVFLTASDVARVFPHPLAQLAAWIVAGLFSLAGALTIAELSAAMPEAGGLSVYLDRAFGPFWGFFYGWALFVVIQTAAIAAVAVAFASYFAHFVALSPRGAEALAICAIGALTFVNVLGVREGVVTQNVMTFAKIAVIAGLVVLAFAGRAGSLANFASPSAVPAASVAAMGAALVGPLFAFDGWITISYMGGEVKRPARALPLAALASVAIVAAIYLALNGAYLFVLG